MMHPGAISPRFCAAGGAGHSSPGGVHHPGRSLAQRFPQRQRWPDEGQARATDADRSEALKAKPESPAKALVSSLVDMARAEACEMMGEKQRALSFAERHL